MIFLIEYDRMSGKSLRIDRFADSDRQRAEDARLEIELEHHARGATYEVVLLEAESEAALRRTHSRYFETLDEMVARIARSTGALVAREDKK